MNRKITYKNRLIRYEFKKSKRAKRARIVVSGSEEVELTVPRHFPEFLADKIIREKADWILRKIEYFRKKDFLRIPEIDKKDANQYKKTALEKIKEIIGRFNRSGRFKIKRISIRDQKTRWGSCSGSGNLSFNYKLIFLPPDLIDYVIVHELVHLEELNHSAKFWKMVERILPDYEERRKRMRNIC